MTFSITPIPAEYRDQYGPMTPMDGVHRIMSHCTATQESIVDLGFDWLWQVHVEENGWSGPGYHYAIQHDGTILETRPDEYEGAGCSGQNDHTIHIAYFGGLEDDTMRSKDTRTQAQEDATAWLIRFLADKHSDLDHKADIVGHRDFAAKDCPCYDVAGWVGDVVNEEEQGGTDPEPDMPPITNLIQYIRDLEARIAALEDHNNAWEDKG